MQRYFNHEVARKKAITSTSGMEVKMAAFASTTCRDPAFLMEGWELVIRCRGVLKVGDSGCFRRIDRICCCITCCCEWFELHRRCPADASKSHEIV